ncbi:MAG: leucine-rich repeat domain-containing protein [Mycoplasmoidaceae bacterium]|nr:leucine-rich repeat domain-containing protein [Mycoplasmoidaceae bacterium]
MDHPITKVGKNLCSVSGITELTEVYLPKSVIEIEESAFFNQMKLTTIAMPGVKYVGDSAFRGCNQLTLSQEYDQPILRYVGARAFYLCTRLSLSSKNELYYIGERAFCSSGITDIDIGPYISFIDTDAFTDCLYLENIIISNPTPPKLGGILFYGSSNPQSIKVPLDAVMTYINDDN